MKTTSQVSNKYKHNKYKYKDYLIGCNKYKIRCLELDGDLLSVYGSPAIKYLERPWNKQRAQVTFYSFASSSSLSLSSSSCHQYLNETIALVASLTAINVIKKFTSNFQCDEKMKTVSISCRSLHSASTIFAQSFFQITRQSVAVGGIEQTNLV